jgi:hypothetical protein
MAFRSFAMLALASAVLAQDASNPLIPSGISSSCTDYLTSLNNATDFIACTTPFTAALEQFAPGASSTSPSVTDALSTLCQSDAFSGCPQSTVTAQLGSFYAACSVELTSSPNDAVKSLYDVLYSLVPLRSAICSKDDSGNYCATQLSNSSSTGSVNIVDPEKSQQQTLLQQYLYSTTDGGAALRRDVSNTTSALVPNTTTYQNTNLLFLFLSPDMPASELCTTCCRNIITPYITFESSCPYALGLSNSLLLSGQVPLYNNITSKCGSSFLSGALQAAGGISSGMLSGAAPLAVGQELAAAVTAILGVAAFVAAAL